MNRWGVYVDPSRPLEHSMQKQDLNSEMSDFNIIYSSPVQVSSFYLLLYFRLFEFKQ